jgi:hypothetical protein
MTEAIRAITNSLEVTLLPIFAKQMRGLGGSLTKLRTGEEARAQADCGKSSMQRINSNLVTPHWYSQSGCKFVSYDWCEI